MGWTIYIRNDKAWGIVTAFDIQPPNHSGFNTMVKITGCKCQHICDSVYNLNLEKYGLFDIVTFFGVYCHLRSPLLAFENINKVLPNGGILLVEGAILEGAARVDNFWKNKQDTINNFLDYPIALYVKDEFQKVETNWWIPTMKCLKDIVESCGFRIEKTNIFQNGTRGYIVAIKYDKLPIEHAILE